MSAAAENFKGIEFVRISSLPEEQKQMIWDTFEHRKIIKIVRDNALMNDCILYNDYQHWLAEQNSRKEPTPAFLQVAFRTR